MSPGTRGLATAGLLAVAAWPGLAGAQTASSSSATSASTATTGQATTDAARFLASCHQSLDSGRLDPACQGATYRGDLERLRVEALRTRNPSLITLVGDAYSSALAPVSDSGEAYQWYLMAAVRGDPRAMERLADMYRNGRGVPRDRVKAFGYARATARLAVPGSAAANQAERALAELSQEMSAQEIALAERFANQMQATASRTPGLGPVQDAARDAAGPAAASAGPGTAPRDRAAPDAAWTGPLMSPVPRGASTGNALPGVGNLRAEPPAPAMPGAAAEPSAAIGNAGGTLPGVAQIPAVAPQAAASAPSAEPAPATPAAPAQDGSAPKP
ncbi:sel1 repeat family protein [Ottowia sp.]|uniref:tetratricopeptide repeat protein n=1 Tax=Ottowia sp. TaxID=1898956 RepID=UPI0026133285|nr:sel1 repeat family protein [Ottowia sp.]